MKKFIYASTILFCLFFTSSCRKAERTTPYSGKASAELNGEKIKLYPSAHPSTRIDEMLHIQFNDYDKNWWHIKNLGFLEVPNAVGTYPINTIMDEELEFGGTLSASYFTLEQLGHGLLDIYGPENIIMEENFISIDRIEGDKIWGTFQLTVHAERELSEPDVPETIRITNGEFKTKIIN